MGKWDPLHNKKTVTSLHHSVHAPVVSVPRDSLDLHLISYYQHNLELFPETTDVICHPTRLLQSWQKMKTSNEFGMVPKQGITYGGLNARPSIHSVKLGISANHIAQTNSGFSRKLDGTFYSL